MKKRIVLEVEIPDGPLADLTFNKIWDATIAGINQAKWLFKGSTHGKFQILHQYTEDMKEPKEMQV